MKSEPQKEHTWLAQMVGEWTYESECVMGPDKPTQTFNGSESVRMLGGLWMIGEGKGEMPDGETANMIIMLGYDPAKTHYVGTWVGSMMPMMFVYEGTMDATGKILTLATEGPSFTGDGTTTEYQDIIEIRSADHRTLTSRARNADGTWNQFMKAHYRRKKS